MIIRSKYLIISFPFLAFIYCTYTKYNKKQYMHVVFFILLYLLYHMHCFIICMYNILFIWFIWWLCFIHRLITLICIIIIFCLCWWHCSLAKENRGKRKVKSTITPALLAKWVKCTKLLILVKDLAVYLIPNQVIHYRVTHHWYIW